MLSGGGIIVGSRALTICQIGSVSQLNSVIFREKAHVPVGQKFFSLFPGLGYAAGYKVCLKTWAKPGESNSCRSFKECTSMAVNHLSETT
jgi:hypothetical protein